MPEDKKIIEPLNADFGAVAKALVNVPDPQKPLEATHRGILPIGGLQLECYVLEDGRRVFAKRGMARAIGLKSEGGNAFLKTLGGKKLGSEISEDLREKLENPIIFNIVGADPGHGYEAETLVDVCKSVIRADDSGKLLELQKPMAAQARAIVNALAKVALVALIDEATGYQTERGPDALRLLVQAYIEKEKREWEKEFPDDFYLTLNKVYGSDEYVKRSSGALVINKPQHFGNFTTRYIYEPLENGEVLKELQRLNPKIAATGTRREKLHQFLSKGYGLEKLRERRQEVLTMLKLSDDIDDFKRLYEKRFGPQDDQWTFFPEFRKGGKG
jgi:P63C domain